MAGDPISNPIQVDPEDLFQDFVDYMQSVIPGWEPSDGSLDVWLALGFAQIAAQLGEQASDVATDIFRWYGQNVTGLQPIDAVAATGTVTITGTPAYTVPAGTIVIFTAADGNLAAFTTAADATLDGTGTVSGVAVTASEPGVDGNDITGTGQPESDVNIATVTLAAATAGGEDAETDDAYLLRLVEEEQLRTVSPILPRDFATLAKRVLEVDRAAYLDGYDPSDGSVNNALMLTLVPVTVDGTAVSPSAKTALAAQFGEDGATPMLVGFQLNIADPHYTAVNVTFTATAQDNWDPADVQTAAEQAVAAYLDPANWGQPTTGEQRKFEVQSAVRMGAIYRVLYDVDGLHDVTALTIAGSAADYTLPTTNAEPVPMPTPGTIAGTVT